MSHGGEGTAETRGHAPGPCHVSPIYLPAKAVPGEVQIPLYSHTALRDYLGGAFPTPQRRADLGPRPASPPRVPPSRRAPSPKNSPTAGADGAVSGPGDARAAPEPWLIPVPPVPGFTFTSRHLLRRFEDDVPRGPSICSRGRVAVGCPQAAGRGPPRFSSRFVLAPTAFFPPKPPWLRAGRGGEEPVCISSVLGPHRLAELCPPLFFQQVPPHSAPACPRGGSSGLSPPRDAEHPPVRWDL